MKSKNLVKALVDFLKSVAELFAATTKRWAGDNMPSMSASLAFHALLSMAPLLLVLVAALRFIFSKDVIEQHILAQVARSIGPEAVDGVRIVLRNAVEGRANAIFIGGGTIILLLVFSAGFFRQLIHALNIVWRVHEEKAGIVQGLIRLVRGHFLAFAMVICIVLYLYATVLIKAVAIVPEQAFLRAFPAAASLLPRLPHYLAPVILFVLFALLFMVLPARKISLRDVWAGSLLTTILFVACYRLIQSYLRYAAVTSYYGAAGSFIVILLWIYWSAMILLFGAEFSKAYAERYGTLKKR